MLKFILAVIILCIIGIFVTYLLPIPISLKDGITAEIIGGGVLGAIVAGIFFYLEESSEYQIGKTKSLSFVNNKLLLDIKEVSDRDPSAWNLGGRNKFYFDSSYINSLFDVYQANFAAINDYTAYFPKDTLITKYTEFYKQVRKGYVLGEKLENRIRQFVRAEHHKLNVDSINDEFMLMYIKGRIFTTITDSGLIKHLDWKSVPVRAQILVKELNNNDEVKKLIQELLNARKDLLKSEELIFKLAESYKQSVN
jgi:hypothetical protein